MTAAAFAWWTATTALVGLVLRHQTLQATRCVDGAAVPNGKTMIMGVVFADDERVWLSGWHDRAFRRGRVLVAGHGRFRVAVWPGCTRPLLLHRSLTPWGDASRRRAVAGAPARRRIP